MIIVEALPGAPRQEPSYPIFRQFQPSLFIERAENLGGHRLGFFCLLSEALCIRHVLALFSFGIWANRRFLYGPCFPSFGCCINRFDFSRSV